MKLIAHCAAWIGAFCFVLVSPVALIFAVPFAIGFVSDAIAAGFAPLAAVPVAAGMGCVLLRNPPLRASAKALCRSAAPLAAARRLAHAVASRYAAKSIS
ncbi:MAG TPA: hypothetical protein VF007_11540 [Stellaceae bacterium]